MNAARSSTFNIMFDDKPLERTSPEHLSPEHQQIIPSVQPIYPTTNLAIEPASAPSSQKGDTGNKEKGSHRKEYNKDIGDIIDTEEYIVNREDSSERPISTPSEDAYKGDLGGVQSADRENEQFAAFIKNLEKAKYECEGMNVQGQGTQNIQKINITKEKDEDEREVIPIDYENIPHKNPIESANFLTPDKMKSEDYIDSQSSTKNVEIRTSIKSDENTKDFNRLSSNSAKRNKSPIQYYCPQKPKDFSKIEPIMKGLKSPPQHTGNKGGSGIGTPDHITTNSQDKLKIQDLLKKSTTNIIAPDQSKYNKLMNYLEEVDEEVAKTEIRRTQISSIDFEQYNPKHINSETLFDIKGKVSNMTLELQECYNTIQSLRDALVTERESRTELIKTLKAEQDINLDKQKAEFESVIERHVNFLDQLVNDKKELTDRCEAHKNKIRELEHRSEKKLKDLGSKHDVQLKKNKEAWLASEKLRREKWMQEKTHEIKEVTVRGLEPEIQRILMDKKKELRVQEDKHQQQLLAQKELIVAEYEDKIKVLKGKLQEEHEEMIEKERGKSQVKLGSQYTRLEKEYEEQKKRWKDSILEECSRVELLRRKDQQNYELQIDLLSKQNEEKVQKNNIYYKEKMDEIERRYKNEIKDIKENIKVESTEWKDRYIKKQNEELKEKMKGIRDQMIKERNKEIELVINKIGDETYGSKQALIKEYDQKISDQEIRYKNELELLSHSVEDWMKRYKEMKKGKDMLDENLDILSRKLADNEYSKASNSQIIEQLECTIERLNGRLGSINSQHQTEQMKIDEQYILNRERLEKEIRAQNEEIVDLKGQFQSHTMHVQEKYRKEMEDLEERIKRALTKKEEVIHTLKEENLLRMGQIEKYKELLVKQRKELLGAH